MIDTTKPLELNGKLTEEFLAQIEASRPSAGAFWTEPRWLRAGAFFLAFIVAPGLMGGLGITSDLFNVGLMTGGFAAMILDGTLMDQKKRKSGRKVFRLIRNQRRSIGPEGLACDDDGFSLSFPWASVRGTRLFPAGIGLMTGRRSLFPVAASELPDGCSLDDLKAAIAFWRAGAAPEEPV